MGQVKDLGSPGGMDRSFIPEDPDGTLLMDELKELAGKGKALRCLHCEQVVSIEKIVAERQEYCSCGAAWYMDGCPVEEDAS